MRKVSVITAALAMILAVAAPVAAAPPEGVTLEGPSYFTGTGEFTTTDEAGLTASTCRYASCLHAATARDPLRSSFKCRFR